MERLTLKTETAPGKRPAYYVIDRATGKKIAGFMEPWRLSAYLSKKLREGNVRVQLHAGG